MSLALVQFIKVDILVEDVKKPLSYQPDIIPGRTLVRHLNNDWVAVKEDPSHSGYIWLNIGILGGRIQKNEPVLIQYGDAIYRERRIFYPEPIPLPKIKALETLPEPKVEKDRSEVLRVPKALQNPSAAWDYVESHGYKREPILEHYLAQDAKYAYKYAYRVLKAPFFKAEKTIATSPDYAYFYASNVLKNRWPAAEPTIAQNTAFTNMYCSEFNLTFDPTTKTFS